MGANAARAVQEARRGAVWWKEPGLRAPCHSCRPRIPLGIPLQAVTSLPYKVLTVFFLISRQQLLPSNILLKGWVKPVYHAWEAEAKEANSYMLKSCGILLKRHYEHSGVQAATSRFLHNIFTSLSSRDVTPDCTWTGHPSVLRTNRDFESSALKGNYIHNGTIVEIKDPTVTVVLETKGSLVAPIEQCSPRTFRKWTSKRLRSQRRVRLKPSQEEAQERFGFVADFKTLMFFNVYIIPECLSALTTQKPLILLLKFVRSHCNLFKPLLTGKRHSCVTFTYTVLYKEVTHTSYSTISARQIH